jgi:hypothetical protein
VETAPARASPGAVAAGANPAVPDDGVVADPAVATGTLLPDLPSAVAPDVLPVRVPGAAGGPGDDATGLESPGFGVSLVPTAVLHGARRNRLRGRSLPNQPATHGPIRSTTTTATPAPRQMRNQRALKMLGGRRMRRDPSDLTRLMLEFPKYDRMLAGQC